MKRWLLMALAAMAAGCRVVIPTPENGRVVSEVQAYDCSPGPACVVEVVDVHYRETFRALPDEGYQFTGWKRGGNRLCSGRGPSCELSTAGFDAHPALMGILESDAGFRLEPRFEPVQLQDYYPFERSVANFLAPQFIMQGDDFSYVPGVMGRGLAAASSLLFPLAGASPTNTIQISFWFRLDVMPDPGRGEAVLFQYEAKGLRMAFRYVLRRSGALRDGPVQLVGVVESTVNSHAPLEAVAADFPLQEAQWYFLGMYYGRTHGKWGYYLKEGERDYHVVINRPNIACCGDVNDELLFPVPGDMRLSLDEFRFHNTFGTPNLEEMRALAGLSQ